jgi:transcriptional regulator with XRE-family HTH domain
MIFRKGRVVKRPLVGTRLREQREKLGYTQEDVAKAVGVNKNQIYRYENETSMPGADVLGGMADYLKVSADYLLGLTDNPSAFLDTSDLSTLDRSILGALKQGDIRSAVRLVGEYPSPKPN